MIACTKKKNECGVLLSKWKEGTFYNIKVLMYHNNSIQTFRVDSVTYYSSDPAKYSCYW